VGRELREERKLIQDRCDDQARKREKIKRHLTSKKERRQRQMQGGEKGEIVVEVSDPVER